MICFAVEIVGLLLTGIASAPWMAKMGVFLAGAGFSLVFPALGVVAVKAVPQQNQGAALATYTVFMDMSLGITGPLAGLVMAWAGVPVIYLAAAGGAGDNCPAADVAAKKMAPGAGTGGHVIIVKRYWITMVLMMFSAAVCAFC